MLGKILVEERKTTVPNVSQRPRKWLVEGQVCTESQGSKWDVRRAQSILALKHLGPFSAGFLTVSIVSRATKFLILFYDDALRDLGWFQSLKLILFSLSCSRVILPVSVDEVSPPLFLSIVVYKFLMTTS